MAQDVLAEVERQAFWGEAVLAISLPDIIRGLGVFLERFEVSHVDAAGASRHTDVRPILIMHISNSLVTMWYAKT